MIVLESLRWVLTAAFAAVTAYHLAGYLRPRHVWQALDVPHLLMGPAMIIMIWPWGRVVPSAAWLIVFAGATGWFLAQIAWSSGARRYFVMFSASAMGAMVWMGAAPSAPAASSMPGMDMSMARASSLNWVSVGWGAYLMLAAFLWLFRGFRLSAASFDRRPSAGVATIAPVPGSVPATATLPGSVPTAAVSLDSALVGGSLPGGGMTVAEHSPDTAAVCTEGAADALNWGAVCHGVMSAAMGLALLAMP